MSIFLDCLLSPLHVDGDNELCPIGMGCRRHLSSYFTEQYPKVGNSGKHYTQLSYALLDSLH